MAGALFGIDIQLGEAAVEPTPPVQRHRRVAGGGEQRMREADPVTVEFEHASLLGELDVVDHSGSQRLEQHNRGSGEGGDGNKRLAYARRQCAQPLRHQGDEAFGQSDVRAVHANRAVDEPAAELQREERIPADDLVDAQKQGSRQVEREPTPEKPMDRPDAERARR